LKAQTLTKSGLLQLHRGGNSFDSLGGLKALKAFCKRSLLQTGRQHALRRPRGALLLGVPGVGKSAFAKALGTEAGRPTLLLDVGTLFGSLVGQTEQNVRQALRIAEAMAPCILFIDEIEKGLSGVGGASDSGVSSRLFGTFLTWLNDHQSEVYVVATCNDISRRSSRGPNALTGSSFWTCRLRMRSLRFGSCTVSNTNSMPSNRCRLTSIGPEPRSAHVVVWPRCWTCR
jgi:hypothetical protein